MEIKTKAVKPATLDRERIGKAIRTIRNQQKIDAKSLALLAGIDSGNLCRIEQGKYSVGLDMLTKIVAPLGYRVDIVPIPDKVRASEESLGAKNKRRYYDLDLELLKPLNDYDYEEGWVSAGLIELLGINLEKLSLDEIAILERRLTFARCVIFGNSRCLFNYGQVAGLYIQDLMTDGESISKEKRDIILTTANFVCNLISDAFVKELKQKGDDHFETLLAEAFDYFYELTAKWMYMNGYSKENQDYALKAAHYAITTRLYMIPVENMLQDAFPDFGSKLKFSRELEYNICMNPIINW